MKFSASLGAFGWSYAVLWTTVTTVSQSTNFNSTFSLSQQQILEANFTAAEVESINNIINWERSQYAGGPTTEDIFYNPPTINDTSSLQPGDLLKSEDFTNISTYSLSPNLGLSRILYVSQNLNGSSLPTSAFILWPFTPRRFPHSNSSSAPVVIWNHMTSGFFGPAAPSKHRTLFAGDSAPFALALAGYAVVAPDYIGLGVSHNFDGKLTPHQYIAGHITANDGIFAFQAAKSAFSGRLSNEFVVMGHSQGGGVAWGTAELLAERPELAKGYLGTVAVSPVTSAFTGTLAFVAPFVGFGLSSVFPNFQLSDWLTPFGLGRANVFQQIQGGLATGMAFFTSENTIQIEGFDQSWEAKAYAALVNVGSRKIKGPLLIIQGTEDVFVSYAVTSATMNATCVLYPKNQIEYVVSNGTGHVPTLDASRSLWMSWIEDRFSGKPVQEQACGKRYDLESFLPIERYQAVGNSFVQWAGSDEYSYEVPLAL
ncbi:Alpha/Beta hydrolase protein [Xylogone sp. PMI_703]|nr:Alpha/Beta hydrolase protein [Xylogone sp. PMI_703]